MTTDSAMIQAVKITEILDQLAGQKVSDFVKSLKALEVIQQEFYHIISEAIASKDHIALGQYKPRYIATVILKELEQSEAEFREGNELARYRLVKLLRGFLEASACKAFVIEEPLHPDTRRRFETLLNELIATLTRVNLPYQLATLYEAKCALQAVKLHPKAKISSESKAEILKRFTDFIEEDPFALARAGLNALIDIVVAVYGSWKSSWYLKIIELNKLKDSAKKSDADLLILQQIFGQNDYRKGSEEIQYAIAEILEEIICDPEVNEEIKHHALYGREEHPEAGVDMQTPGLVYFVGSGGNSSLNVFSHWTLPERHRAIRALVNYAKDHEAEVAHILRGICTNPTWKADSSNTHKKKRRLDEMLRLAHMEREQAAELERHMDIPTMTSSEAPSGSASEEKTIIQIAGVAGDMKEGASAQNMLVMARDEDLLLLPKGLSLDMALTGTMHEGSKADGAIVSLVHRSSKDVKDDMKARMRARGRAKPMPEARWESSSIPVPPPSPQTTHSVADYSLRGVGGQTFEEADLSDTYIAADPQAIGKLKTLRPDMQVSINFVRGNLYKKATIAGSMMPFYGFSDEELLELLDTHREVNLGAAATTTVSTNPSSTFGSSASSSSSEAAHALQDMGASTKAT